MEFIDHVNYWLDRIDTLYPQQEIEKRKAKLTAFWNGEAATGRIPYVVMHFPHPADAVMPDGLDDRERDLLSQLMGIAGHAAWRDDYVPSISPGLRQVLIPAFFGCVEEFASLSVRTKPIIHQPQDVYNLPEIGFAPGTPGGDMLEKMAWQLEVTQRRLAIAETDMQGPYSVASQIWDVQEFLLAGYEYPDEVNHLLKRTTAAEILFLEKMRDVSGDLLSSCHCMPCLWMPQGRGVCVSEDLLAVVSPKTVTEMIGPSLEAIGEAFGGVLVHTCGSLNHAILPLMQLPHLFGVNCSTSETRLGDMVETGGKRLVYATHSSPVACEGLRLLTPWEQAELCRDVYASAGVAGLAMINPLDTPLDADRDAGKMEMAMVI